ncbi:MAG: GatB/YqeY domain-containing protein [Nitrospinae bacterium]|nr:GatB/YqeY domain-containing protein [Nitrospinota bacterium]
MSDLRKRIFSDLIEAMKKKEAVRLDTLRLLKAEIMKFEVSGKAKVEAGASEILPLVTRLIKQRREAAEQFRKGGREEMAMKEEAELKVLEDYLPAQLTAGELEQIVREAIEQVGAKDKAAMGKIMGVVMGKVKGKADGATVKSTVEKLLS